MQQQPPGRSYGAGFITFLAVWLTAGALGLVGIVAYLISNVRDTSNPMVAVGALSLVLSGLAIYSFPTLVARISEHPSRTGITFVNWFLGWTIVAWIGSMIWALSGFNARWQSVRHNISTSLDAQKIASRYSALERTLPTVFGLCTALLLLWGFYARILTGSENSKSLLSGSGDVVLPGKKVTARGLGLVPGAFVCKDLTTVGQLVGMYGEAWLAQQRARHMSQDQKLLTGDPGEVSLPNPDDYGCILVRAGGTMFAEGGHVIPIIRVALENGDVFEGVTNPDMIVKPDVTAGTPTFTISDAPTQSPPENQRAMENAVPVAPIEPSQVKAPEPASLPAPATIFRSAARHWFTLRNGDLVLDSIHDPCARIVMNNDGSPGIELLFKDGRSRKYASDEAMKAQEIAEASCPMP